MAALSVDRALAVTRPTTGTSMRTRTGIKIISISIWLCATLLALPETIYSTIVFQGNITACGMKFPIPSNATDDQIEERFNCRSLKPIDRVIWEVNWVNLPLGKRGGHLYEKSWKDWYLKSGIYELLKCIFGFFGPICIILYSYSAILYTGLLISDRIMSKHNIVIHLCSVRPMLCLPEKYWTWILVQWKLIGGQNGKARATKLAAIIVTTFIIWWV